MTISKRNTQGQIQRQAPTEDAAGQPVGAWVDLGPAVWADIRTGSGLATIKAGGDVSIVKASIRILRRTDVEPGMRVVAGAFVYKVEAVPPPRPGSAEMDLICTVLS
jgi:SPP1 family predicted phage head-tail adaptor